MQLLLPEILAEVRELSLFLIISGFLAGGVLWLAGWWSYRFWADLTATVGAGIFGLYYAESLYMLPVVAALLLALSAGILALSIMRIVTFLLGGIAVLLLVGALVPGADAPLICLLAGGMASVLLFRLWIMLLTSFCGTVVIGYCLLSLSERVIKFDSVHWCQDHTTLLDWICGVFIASGFVGQIYLEKKRKAAADSEGGSGFSLSKIWKFISKPFVKPA